MYIYHVSIVRILFSGSTWEILFLQCQGAKKDFALVMPTFNRRWSVRNPKPDGLMVDHGGGGLHNQRVT